MNSSLIFKSLKHHPDLVEFSEANFFAFRRIDRIQDFLIRTQSRNILYGAGRLGAFALELHPFFYDFITDENIDSARILSEKTGIPFLPIEDISRSKKETTIFVATTKFSFRKIALMFQEFGIDSTFHVYEAIRELSGGRLNNGWFNPGIIDSEFDLVRSIFDKLHDSQSRHHYLSFLLWHLESIDSYDRLSPPLVSSQFALDYFQGLDPLKIFASRTGVIHALDAGSSDGSFIVNVRRYLPSQPIKFTQFEPRGESPAIINLDSKDSSKNQIYAYTNALSDVTGKSRFCAEFGMAARLCENGTSFIETCRLDDFNLSFDLMKFHLEGNELKALIGSLQTLQRKPLCVLVTSYHNFEGVFQIQNFLIDVLGKSYRFYFHNHGYAGTGAVFKAVKI